MKVETKDNIRVVTANEFIKAQVLPGFTTKERKLLYIAISQCKMNDSGFYDYTLSIKDFAEMMGIDPSNVYQESETITANLCTTQILIEKANGKGYKRYNLFSYCDYDNEKGIITFKLNSDMTDFFLRLEKNFSKPLLEDFLKMKSPYSMAIWHLMQREMNSKKPYADKVIEFDLSLKELREVTGTENKLKQVSEFRIRVLEQAQREIADNCGVNITFTPIKEKRTITGYHFTAASKWYNPNTTPEQKARLEAAKVRGEIARARGAKAHSEELHKNK